MSYTRTTWADGATALSAEHMNNIEDGIEEAFSMAEGNSTMWSYIRNLVYPVGSIYMSATLSTVADVEAALGGTWVAWGSGRVPVGVDTSKAAFDTAEETGGSADAVVPYHTHTFTGNQLATHNHTQASHQHPGPTVENVRRNYLVVDQAAGVQNKYAAISGHDWYAPYTYTDGYGFRSVANTPTATATNNPASAGTPSGTNSYAGTSGNTTNANLQPYITCYMYKRTA